MIIPRACANQAEFGAAVSEVERQFHPWVIHIRYSFREDSSGEPAVFFKILLSDEASRRDGLLDLTNRISDAILWQVEPLERWGVLPYFNYRSKSEQAVLQEPAWV